jgi:hypothetical protein
MAFLGIFSIPFYFLLFERQRPSTPKIKTDFLIYIYLFLLSVSFLPTWLCHVPTGTLFCCCCFPRLCLPLGVSTCPLTFSCVCRSRSTFILPTMRFNENLRQWLFFRSYDQGIRKKSFLVLIFFFFLFFFCGAITAQEEEGIMIISKWVVCMQRTVERRDVWIRSSWIVSLSLFMDLNAIRPDWSNLPLRYLCVCVCVSITFEMCNPTFYLVGEIDFFYF